MTPATYDLPQIVRGATFGPITIRCKDSNDAAVPLTGWLVFAHVRKSPEAALAFDLAPQITDEEAGEITISFTAEETAALPSGSYSWDLLLQNPAGRRNRYIVGTVTVTKPITQP